MQHFKTSLLQQFTLLTLSLFILFGAGFAYLLSDMMQRDQIREAKESTAANLSAAIRDHLSAEELATLARNERPPAIDEKIFRLPLGLHGGLTKIWTRDKTVAWSSMGNLIGQHSPGNHELDEAFAGEICSEITSAAELARKYAIAPTSHRVLELYVPIRAHDDGPILIVFEVYEDLEGVFSKIDGHNKVIWGTTALSFSLFFVILFGLIRRASQQLVRNEQEQRQLQERLFLIQKNESLGQLASGISHDFNNLLTIINGYTDLAMSHLDAAHPALADLRTAREAGGKATALTRQLLAFSRKQVLQMQPIDLNQNIANLAKLLHSAINNKIRLDIQTSATPLPLLADAGQLDQVLMNLVLNARDAMLDGGVVTVRTTLTPELDSCLAGLPNMPVCPCAVLTVADTGHGMRKEIMQKIFEPLFTTKEDGKGTGLGLATVHGIIKQHKGHIEVASEPGKGTTFTIYLPLTEQP